MGHDHIDAGSGSNGVSGGAGNDLIFGGAGNDRILGGSGNDEIQAGAGDDTIIGGAGEDQLSAGAGADMVLGGPDDDVLSGDDGADLLVGGAGRNLLAGGNDNDRLFADLDDTLVGGAGSNQYLARGGVVGGESPTGPEEYDTNLDNTISAIDVLLVINALNRGENDPTSSSPALDTNRDGVISPLDALLLVNFINFRASPSIPGKEIVLDLDLLLPSVDESDPEDTADEADQIVVPDPPPWDLTDAELAGLYTEAVDAFFTEAETDAQVAVELLDYLALRVES